ncbi:hypothetical protein [Paenibacillus sp. MMS20-IR301]|uniref:hypothetical protein n=1 Tax=Paenibacillus sp. MMS20-IR301 TaxID=2895946 RepID=UPI0028F14B7B|nr:hypothetical protein [Paenibacillus sp. MMS20-IR301]WNS41905.1 hypothetical protein LOS79_23245 [Paenibacillus sp. MMS20-IR301]
MKNLYKPGILLLSLLIALAVPAASAAAAATVFTSSIQTSFDLTAATADSTARARLKSQYTELTALSAEYDSREVQIRKLHDDNTLNLTAVREAIKNIDQDSINRLTASVTSTKERYQPLFDQYSALNKRISLLKGLKDKTLNSVLKLQSEAMKLMVQAARQEIRDKEALLKSAKETRARRIASARKTLAGIESPQISIKSQKSAASALNKRLSADWSDFKAAIRKQNPVPAGQSLSAMNATYRQIAASKQKIIEYEQRIAGIIAATRKEIGS